MENFLGHVLTQVQKDESVLDTATRLLVDEAMVAAGSQRQAAMLLRVTQRQLNYLLYKRRLRPCDKHKVETPMAEAEKRDEARDTTL